MLGGARGRILAVLVALAALSAGCLGGVADEIDGTEEGEAEGAELLAASSDDGNMTARESSSTDEDTREGLPPFHATRTVTVEGELTLDALPVALSAFDGGIDVSTGPEGVYELTATFTGYGYTADQAARERDRVSLSWSIGEPGDRELVAEVEREEREEEMVDLEPGTVEDHLELTLPPDLTTVLAAEARDGDVSVDGLEGPAVSAETRDGDLSVSDVRADALTAESRDGDVAVSDVVADAVTVTSRDGDAGVSDIEADALTLETRDGAVAAADAAVAATSVSTRDGPVDVDLTSTGAVSVETRDGDVAATVVPGESGAVAVQTRDGHVDVSVPEGDAYGYDALAASDDGRAEIDLKEGSTREAGDGAVAFRTDGYDDRDVRTKLDATARDGDVVVGPT